MANERIKTWELERYLLGELPSSRMNEIDRLAQENPGLKKEIDNLKKTNAEIIKQNPTEAMLPGIMRIYEKNRPRARSREKAGLLSLKHLLYGTPVLTAALILMFVVLFRDGDSPGQNRIKGEDALDFTKTQILIYRKNRDQVELLKNGDKVRYGDLVQLGYIPAGKTYGVIFSIDGNGVITLHYPEKTDGSTFLNQEKKNLLNSAYELDNAPDFERFFFITAEGEIDVTKIIIQAEELADSSQLSKTKDLDLPESYQQFSILLKKGEKV
jgi:hypothetical protein